MVILENNIFKTEFANTLTLEFRTAETTPSETAGVATIYTKTGLNLTSKLFEGCDDEVEINSSEDFVTVMTVVSGITAQEVVSITTVPDNLTILQDGVDQPITLEVGGEVIKNTTKQMTDIVETLTTLFNELQFTVTARGASELHIVTDKTWGKISLKTSKATSLYLENKEAIDSLIQSGVSKVKEIRLEFK